MYVLVVDQDCSNDSLMPADRPSLSIPIEMLVPTVNEFPTASEDETVCVMPALVLQASTQSPYWVHLVTGVS